MEIDKIDLTQALTMVKPGLASQEMIDQSTHFAFMDDKIVTYNDEISISHPLPVGFTGAVKAEELYAFLNKSKAKNIKLEPQENELHIKAGRSKVWLVFHSKIVLPLDEIDEATKWKKVPSDFLDALRFTSQACATDMSSPGLTCVRVRKDGVAEATDSFRIAQYPLPDFTLKKDILIPKSSIVPLLNYDVTHISISDSWVHFKTEEGSQFSCRLMAAEMPELDAFFEFKGRKLLFPDGIEKLLERASIFLKESEEKFVTIAADEKKMVISSQGKTGGFEEPIKLKEATKYLEFIIMPQLLQTILASTNKCIVSKDALKFKSKKWRYMTKITQS